MEFSRAKIGLVIAVAIATAGMSVLLNTRQSNLEAQIREMEGYGPTWNQREAYADLDEAAKSFDQAINAVRAQNYDDIYLAYRDAHTAAGRWVEHHPNQTYRDGATLSTWLDARESEFREAMLAQMDRMVASLESGQTSWPQFKQMLANFSSTDFREFEEEFETIKPQVIRARSKSAPNWFRVSFGGYTHQYEDALYDMLREKWNAEYGKDMVLGFAMDNEEKQTTWKKLYIQVDQEAETYSGGDNRSTVTFPYKTTLSFKIEGAEGVTTNWDTLPPITAEAELPETIWVEADRFDDTITASGWAKLRDLERDAFNQIFQRLEEGLAQLPEFELFPGLDTSRMQIVQNGRVDTEAVRVLGYLDPDRLMEQLPQLTDGTPPEGAENVPAILVELDLTEAAPWVVAQMPELERDAERALMKALTRRPWFGDYAAATAIVNNFDGNWPPGAADIFRYHLDAPELQRAFMAKIDELDDYRRQNLISFFLASVPLDAVESKLDGWVRSEDKDFANTVFFGVKRRDEAQAQRLALVNFDYVSEEVQASAMRSLEVGYGTEDPGESFELLVNVLRSTDSESVRQTAYEKVLETANTDYGWDALEKLERTEADPRMKERIQWKLCDNVEYAHPDKAIDYLYDQLFNHENVAIRAAAAFNLIRSDAETTFLTESLVEAAQSIDDDSDFLNRCMNAIDLERGDKRGWDYHNDPNLETLLTMGMEAENDNTRTKAYQIMARAIENGAEKYRERLEVAVNNEPDDRVRSIARKLPVL